MEGGSFGDNAEGVSIDLLAGADSARYSDVAAGVETAGASGWLMTGSNFAGCVGGFRVGSRTVSWTGSICSDRGGRSGISALGCGSAAVRRGVGSGFSETGATGGWNGGAGVSTFGWGGCDAGEAVGGIGLGRWSAGAGVLFNRVGGTVASGVEGVAMGDGSTIVTFHVNGSGCRANSIRCTKRMAATVRLPCSRHETSHPVARGPALSMRWGIEAILTVESLPS
jgi:hypothetical protein